MKKIRTLGVKGLFLFIALVIPFLSTVLLNQHAVGSVSDQDLDRVDMVVKLEVNGKLIFEKRVSPRFGEKRTLSKTLYDDKAEYELELLPSRYNDNAALVEASITKISDFGPSHRQKTLLSTPKLVTLNKIEASVESSAQGTTYKLSVLPSFHDL